MSRAYIKLSPDLPDRKDFYPDGAFRALVTAFCTASYQTTPGIFVSERLVKAMLGKQAKWLAFLLEQRDLEARPDGTYHVVGWEEWQEGKFPSVQARLDAIKKRRGALSPAERAFLYRQRKSDAPSDAERDASHQPSPMVPSDVTLRNVTEPDVTTGRTPVTKNGLRSRETTNGFPGTTPKPADEELIERNLRLIEDPSTSEHIREAARFQLAGLGVHK